MIKSISVDPEVAEYLESSGNASATVTKLVRRRMLTERVALAAGRPVDTETREKARRWARAELDAARDAVDGGAYDEIRSQMGWAA